MSIAQLLLVHPLSETDHECHHEREQTSGFSEGETQNGIREQLSPQAWIACHTSDQGTENRTNTHTSSGKTNGSKTGTNVATGFDEGVGELGGVRAGSLTSNHASHGGVADVLALQGLEGGVDRSIVAVEVAGKAYQLMQISTCPPYSKLCKMSRAPFVAYRRCRAGGC